MSRKIRYTDEPMEGEVVKDFLPPPDELVLNDPGVKITISLSRKSVEFFKAAAERNQTSYQRMIRRLLDSYAEKYGSSAAPVKTRARRPVARSGR